MADAQKIHGNKYDYSLVEYVTAYKKVKIVCHVHGEFNQNPTNHLSGQGCPTCSYRRMSKPETRWLDILGVPVRNSPITLINNRLIKPDGFDPATNTVYEFHGDFWHGNPKIYKHNDINPRNGKTYGELYEDTLKREQEIRDNGYNVITIWENEFYDQ